jgi:hypothetical protein
MDTITRQLRQILSSWQGAGREPEQMDILMMMFFALISTMTALTFVETRRIRKRLERTSSETPKTSAARV